MQLLLTTYVSLLSARRLWAIVAMLVRLADAIARVFFFILELFVKREARDLASALPKTFPNPIRNHVASRVRGRSSEGGAIGSVDTSRVSTSRVSVNAGVSDRHTQNRARLIRIVRSNSRTRYDRNSKRKGSPPRRPREGS